jgi:calcineurin-like phosphoesterase family protein
MSEVRFTSDLHFGHHNILAFTRRPWPDVESMNRCLVQNWNEVVSSTDTTFVLGDFAMGTIAETLPIAKDLNGHKILIPGNHDRCHPMHKKADQWAAKYEAVGFSVQDPQMLLAVNGIGHILLCHFPHIGDSHDQDRFDEWRPVDNGIVTLLHGHVHGKRTRTGERTFDVGVDANGYKPVTINEILNGT